MSEIRYLDFDLRIERGEEGYIARVLNCPAGEASTDFALPFSTLELENFVLRVGRTRRGRRRLESPEMEAAKIFGGRLFEAVFQGDVRGCFDSSLDTVRRQGLGLRLRLRLEAPEVADLPWEYLYNPALNRFLSLSVETPLVRYLSLPERIQPLAVTPPLRVLVMIASPSDYPALEVEREWQKLQIGVSELESSGRVVLERLEAATLSALQARLRKGGYHIFHFIGHGAFDERAQDGVLLLEDEEGRGRPVSGQYVGTLLHDERTLRLAILNACEGARTSATDPFAGTAQSLVQQGIPAVIAMQFEITDEAAITLAHEFYQAVADGYPVDAALVEARKAIFAQGNDVEWGTPVLYLRTPTGQIFDVAQVSEEERRQAQANLLYHQAQSAMEGQEWGPAAERLQAVLDLTPQHAEAQAALQRVNREQELATLVAEGQKQYEAGRYREALDCLRRVRNLQDDYEGVNGLIATVESALDAKRRQESIAALYGEAQAALARQDWSTAIDKLQAVLDLEPGHAMAAAQLARAREQQAPAIAPPQPVAAPPKAVNWLAIGIVVAVAAILLIVGGIVVLPGLLDAGTPTPTVTVSPSPETPTDTPPPLVLSLDEWSVFPTEVTAGQPIVIRWRVSNADSVVLEPFGPVDRAGEREEVPAQTRTYRLIARGQGQTLEESQQVVVLPLAPGAPEVRSFVVEPDRLVRGEVDSVRLSWDTEGADTVTIEPGLGPVGLAGSREMSAPAVDTVYILVARGAGQETRARVQVTVEEPLCRVVSQGLNLRSGPGMVYEPPLRALAENAELEPLAFFPSGYPEGQWIQVRVPGTHQSGWVSAKEQYVKCNFDASTLPRGSAPATPAPKLPDLIVEIDGIDNTTIVQGEEPQTLVHYRVINAGDGPTPAGPISLRLWVNGGPTTPDWSVNGPIQPGVEVTHRFAVGQNSSWWVGDYVIKLEADYLGEIEESDEGNNFSGTIAFDVISPPSPIATVTLYSIDAESGSVRSDGLVNAQAKNVGDTTINQGIQAFLSFDLSGIPAGSTIVDVQVDFRNSTVYGDPFGSPLGDGCLRAYAHAYGTLDGSDYFAGSPLGAIVRFCSAGELGSVRREESVIGELQAALGNARFQIRLQFQRPESDNDTTMDAVQFGSVKLIVTYEAP